MSEARIIKKYANRRLYDTARSSYIALDDVRQLVLDGFSLQVVDAKTGEDITRGILLQIIVEQEEKGQPILSTDLLEKIIRFYGDTLQVFISTYLEKSLDSFVLQQSQLEKEMASWMEKTPATLFTEMTRNNLELLQNLQQDYLRASGLGKVPGGKADKD